MARPVIGLCPGAEYGPAKRWLPERFAEVMRIVHERTGCEWKIFGVEKDRPIADAIISAAAVPCTDLVGKTSLAQLMEELRACDLLLTNDTGTMHLAAFLGVPTVSHLRLHRADADRPARARAIASCAITSSAARAFCANARSTFAA